MFKTKSVDNSDFDVAIKVMDKTRLRDSIQSFNDHLQILNTVDHPNIVKYFETYDDAKYVY